MYTVKNHRFAAVHTPKIRSGKKICNFHGDTSPVTINFGPNTNDTINWRQMKPLRLYVIRRLDKIDSTGPREFIGS